MAELDRPYAQTIAVSQSIDADGTPVVSLSGELDLSNVERVRDVLSGTLNTGPNKIVFDLTELGFMDSSGIALLLTAAEVSDRVELRHASSMIRRIIDVTGLGEVLRVIS